VLHIGEQKRSGRRIAAVSAVVAVFSYLAFAFFGIALIPTPSMESTVLVGDHLLVAKFLDAPRLPLTNYRLPRIASPRRGEVVSFHPPHAAELVFMKRVVAIAGDSVEIRQGVLYVNGKAVPESYAAPHAPISVRPVTVPEGHIFVLGDNRDNSEDSRYWGTVSIDAVVGRPQLVVWSVRGKTSDWLTENGSVRPQFYWTAAQHLIASTRWARLGLYLQHFAGQ
jgi:signal peptidase I